MSLKSAARRRLWYVGGAFVLMLDAGVAQAYASADTQGIEDLRTEKVVMLMRHGAHVKIIEDMDSAHTVQLTPGCSRPDETISENVRQAFVLSGQYHRERLVSLGVLPALGALEERRVRAFASPTQRTFDTGRAFLDGLIPGNTIVVSTTQTYPWFRRLNKGIRADEVPAATRAVMDAIGMPEEEARRAALPLMERVVDKRFHGESLFASWKWQPISDPRGMTIWPLELVTGVSEWDRSKYVEGRSYASLSNDAYRDRVVQMLAVKRINHDYTEAPRFIAVRHVAALLPKLSDALLRESEESVTLFVGHESNLTSLRAVLGFEWETPDRLYNDIGPGGMLMFERLQRVSTGQRFVRISFHAQTLDQIRYVQPLSASAPPFSAVFTPPATMALVGTQLIPAEGFAAWVKQVVAEAATPPNADLPGPVPDVSPSSSASASAHPSPALRTKQRTPTNIDSPAAMQTKPGVCAQCVDTWFGDGSAAWIKDHVGNFLTDSSQEQWP